MTGDNPILLAKQFAEQQLAADAAKFPPSDGRGVTIGGDEYDRYLAQAGEIESLRNELDQSQRSSDNWEKQWKTAMDHKDTLVEAGNSLVLHLNVQNKALQSITRIVTKAWIDDNIKRYVADDVLFAAREALKETHDG